MSYAHPEVLVNTEWLSQNPPNANRKLVEVDYDPVNGYQKGPHQRCKFDLVET